MSITFLHFLPLSVTFRNIPTIPFQNLPVIHCTTSHHYSARSKAFHHTTSHSIMFQSLSVPSDNTFHFSPEIFTTLHYLPKCSIDFYHNPLNFRVFPKHFTTFHKPAQPFATPNNLPKCSTTLRRIRKYFFIFHYIYHFSPHSTTFYHIFLLSITFQYTPLNFQICSTVSNTSITFHNSPQSTTTLHYLRTQSTTFSHLFCHTPPKFSSILQNLHLLFTIFHYFSQHVQNFPLFPTRFHFFLSSTFYKLGRIWKFCFSRNYSIIKMLTE